MEALDVKEACRLLKVAMQQAATDPLTGDSSTLSRLNPVFQDPKDSEGGLRFATFTEILAERFLMVAYAV